MTRQQQWYYDNREKTLTRTKARHARNKALIDSLKSVPCADGGGRFDPVCMDFDHLHEYEKTKCVGSLVNHSVETILAEAEKCEVVCSNCHRLRTKRRASWS